MKFSDFKVGEIFWSNTRTGYAIVEEVSRDGLVYRWYYTRTNSPMNKDAIKLNSRSEIMRYADQFTKLSSLEKELL